MGLQVAAYSATSLSQYIEVEKKMEKLMGQGRLLTIYDHRENQPQPGEN